MTTTTSDVDRAAEFLWRHARLLERRRFTHRFERPDPDGVAAAVLAYLNPDGGFGQALEPDCRSPHSQPQATRLALGALADVGRLDGTVAEGAAAWAAGLVTEEGGLPFCLPTVVGYPRAPWWDPGGDPPPANVTPTGGLVGRLREAGVAAAWLDRAEAWCFAELDRVAAAGEAPSQYHVDNLAELCAHAADRPAADRSLGNLREQLAAGRVIPLVPGAAAGPDTHTPLDIAPRPDHPLRPAFPDGMIDEFLDRLAAVQQPDGGWPIDWPAPGETAVWEWRGVRTLGALEVLDAYGRL